eukprot:CAMPEP_0201868900 /NCGR_PEP_ID=MMETSP0902-20130614/2610_1 /ASSEMBLY_ACC=CAM_ASM_000551 /TAXON_ID=420261 /ORGANISM="Thalassiosira antarctica, Strain CCMP982" /LENGTH=526 /DNA_ID=CAMNT_0048394301 /DNA_START=101 /DNA_END=1681 /DNA_ORIENTATION=+
MAQATARHNETYPQMGLQFNPNHHTTQRTQSINSPTTPLGESQEMMVGNAGKAILLGDVIDLESDDGDHHPSASTPHLKSGVCPSWLRSSSPKTKGLLGLTAILLLAFVAVMIVGVMKLSSPTDEGGGVSSVQNTGTDPAITSVPVPTPATPEPSPAPTATAATDYPTIVIEDSMTIPIYKSEVNILLPTFLEMKVPDFSDGLGVTEEQNWNLIAGILETTISTSLTESLPTDYSLDSIQLDNFDGVVTSLIQKRNRGKGGSRYLQTNSEPIVHTVLYSSSVTISCLDSDCTTASDTVASAASALSRLEFLRVSVEMEAPVAARITGSPTKSPVVAVSTPAPIATSPPPTAGSTNAPTAIPVTPQPTQVPVTPAPTTLDPTAPVPMAPAPLANRKDECNEYTPCEECQGTCSDDNECEEGLFCFQRGGYEFIPGCEGPGKYAGNYCYDPLADGLTEDKVLPSEDGYCDKKERCDKCRGDCDEDEDCVKGLFCYRRYAFELVPGCAGQGNFGTDYCFDPVDLPLGDF